MCIYIYICNCMLYCVYIYIYIHICMMRRLLHSWPTNSPARKLFTNHLFTFLRCSLTRVQWSPGREEWSPEFGTAHRRPELPVWMDHRWVIGCSNMFALCLKYWQELTHVLMIWCLDLYGFQDLGTPSHVFFLKRPFLGKLKGASDLEFTRYESSGHSNFLIISQNY